MKINQIHHIAIICSDYEITKKFYTDILGLKVIHEKYRADRNSWKCDLAINDKYQIELFSFPTPPERLTQPEACGLRHLAFEVDDLDEVVNELHAKGIAVEPIRKDTVRNNKRFTFIADPDGTPIEFCEK
jgi:glyoxylase I family protein